jgi:hypothetical protein
VTETDQALAELRAKYGARWEIWYVPHSVQRGGTWCANPWSKKDDRRNVLHADKPEHLAGYIADAEAEAAR